MFRYSDHWQNWGKRFDSHLTDYFETDDFTVRGGFLLYKDYISFSGKRVFGPNNDKVTGEVKKTTSDYDLQVNWSPLSSCILEMFENGDITGEADLNGWHDQNKNYYLNYYNKILVTKNGVNSILQLVFHNRRNHMLNFGWRNWNFSGENKTKFPSLFTIGLMSRLLEREDLSTWGGAQLNFETKKLSDITVLLGAQNSHFHSVLNFGLERTEVHEREKDTNVVKYSNFLNLKSEGKLANDLLLFGMLSFNETNKDENGFCLGGLYTIDQNTKFKFKMHTDCSTTLSLTKNYRNLLDFTFTTNLAFKNANNSSERNHIKTKFGLALNILDEHH